MQIPAGQRSDPKVRELAEFGCGATMHVLRLLAPRLEGESQTKDIDFTGAGVRARWQAGYNDTLAMVDPAALRQSVAAFAVSVWLGAQYPGEWERVTTEKAPRR